MEKLGDLLKDTKVPKFNGPTANLGALISGLLNIALYIAMFMAFYWLVWAALQYIIARGDKEGLSKARDKIKWALIGLVVIFSAFSLAKFAGEIFKGVLKGGLTF